MKTYKIAVKTLQGVILTFSVPSYSIEDGYVVFEDKKTHEIKRFHSTNAEIYEVETKCLKN